MERNVDRGDTERFAAPSTVGERLVSIVFDEIEIERLIIEDRDRWLMYQVGKLTIDEYIRESNVINEAIEHHMRTRSDDIGSIRAELEDIDGSVL